MKPEITKKRIQTHFSYGWWKYLILVSAAIIGWNLIYTTTRYQPPENKKIEWFYQGSIGNDEVIDAKLEEIRTQDLPEMEQITITSAGTDSTYGDMQLSVWMAAGQGDLYHMTTAKFKDLAASEAFVDLQPYIDSGALKTDGLEIYYATNEAGEKYPAGIYTSSLTGLTDWGLDGSDKIMGVLVGGGNTDNTVRFMQIIIDRTREQPAE